MDDFSVGPHKAYTFDQLIGASQIKRWWRDEFGYAHRIEGPAVIWENGRQEWWYHGYKTTCVSQEEFERFLKMKAFW
jgi:hypothetical protein